MKWILAHWGFATGGLITIALIALAVLNLPAFLRLMYSIAGALFGLVDWAVREFRKNGWRASCIAAALVCIAMTWQWQDTRSQLVETRDQVVSINATLATEVQKGKDAVAAQVQRCTAERVVANQAAAKRVAEINAAAKQREQVLKDQIQAIGKTYSQEIERAKATGNAVTAGIRDGSIQLRDEWAGEGGSTDAGRGGGNAMPNAPGSGAGADDAAELRATGAGEAIEDAIRCDVTITKLQDTLKAERRGNGASK